MLDNVSLTSALKQGNSMSRPPVPPFTRESASEKVRGAEDGWNSRDPSKVALAYCVDTSWRKRAEFLAGRAAVQAFLARKWARELDYRLVKEVWAFAGRRMAVRFAFESRNLGYAPLRSSALEQDKTS